MKLIDDYLMRFLDSPWNVAGAAAALLGVLLLFVFADTWWFYLRMIVKSLFRNLVRSTLTSLATMVLVLVITMVWTVLNVLDQVTTEKSADFKAIVTERWQIPSQMPYAYVSGLSAGGATKTDDVRPQDSMTWTFYGGSIDPAKRTRENTVFFFGMDPAKMMRAERDENGNLVIGSNGRPKFTSMMDDMDQLTVQQIDLLDRACREMEIDKRKVILGKDRLKSLQKKVGERMVVTSFNYPGVDLEVEIIGQFPRGRYDNSALVNVRYILDGMDAWKQKNGKPHPMAERALNLVWLRVPDTEAFRQVADQIMDSPSFTAPAVKVETASSGIASFLDAYRDLLWATRWFFVPAVLITMAVVIANAISISVRERRTEMAVLKVLGFRPTQIMILVLGEAVLIGALSGLISAAVAYALINYDGGLKFPIAFFPVFRVPEAAFWWGLAIGGGTALAGSLIPAWSARSVRVAEVFAKVT